MTSKNSLLKEHKSIKAFMFFLSAGIVVAGLFAASGVHAAIPSVVSVKISGSNTVAIVFSEPVNTNLANYSNFGGALSGRNLITLIGSGTNTITLFFDGSSFAVNATGYLTVGSGAISLSDNSSTIGGTFYVSEGRQFPSLSSIALTSNNATSGFVKVGNMITLTFSTNIAVMSPAVTIAGHAITASGNSTGPYTVTYVMSSSDPEGTLPVTISFTDNSGNFGGATLSFTTGAAAPAIASVTSNAAAMGMLKIGDSILFTLTPTAIMSNAQVSGSYNGVPLTWYTTNGGVTYQAVYTVSSGSADQVSPLQITGATITDRYGSTSPAVSGSDVKKSIDAHAPAIYETTRVPSTTASNTPGYAFYSSEPGVLRYGGDCTASTLNAVSGTNTFSFNYLPGGLHSNCIITVTDAAGNMSNQLNVTPFTISAVLVATPTPAPTPVPTPVPAQVVKYKFLLPLKLGSVGMDVIELQKRLAEEGLYSGSATGYYGSLTQTAVKRYQALHGLDQLGNVGPGTRAALNK